MAFVLLPCDLPSWPTVERYLVSLRSASTPEHVTRLIHSLYELCNEGIDSACIEAIPRDYFAGLEKFLTSELNADFFSLTLPFMVEAALQIKNQRFPDGLKYSLQQEQSEQILSRAFVVSLLSHIFFCTWPKRTLTSHPTLTDPRLATLLISLHRDSQQLKLSAFLDYFRLMALGKPQSGIVYHRKVMDSDAFLTLRNWRFCDEPLCPMTVHLEGRMENHPSPKILACFSSAELGRAALSNQNSQQVELMLSSPELVVLSIFAERLEDNEIFHVTKTLQTSHLSYLQTKPRISRFQEPISTDVVYAVMDADDYREYEVLQYEDINILRELNKAYLAFYQPKEAISEEDDNGSLSPDMISVSRQISEEGLRGNRLKYPIVLLK